jgi:hypothetical protein
VLGDGSPALSMRSLYVHWVLRYFCVGEFIVYDGLKRNMERAVLRDRGDSTRTARGMVDSGQNG